LHAPSLYQHDSKAQAKSQQATAEILWLSVPTRILQNERIKHESSTEELGITPTPELIRNWIRASGGGNEPLQNSKNPPLNLSGFAPDSSSDDILSILRQGSLDRENPIPAPIASLNVHAPWFSRSLQLPVLRMLAKREPPSFLTCPVAAECEDI
jgi:hypothetical protein